MHLFPFAFLGIVTHPYDLNDFFLVQIFEPSRAHHVVVILLREQHARVLEALAIESVRVFEDLADGLDRDLLRQNLLHFSLKRIHIKSVGQLKKSH